MTTIEILRAARAKIEKPENWIKGNAECNSTYCAWGAVLHVARYDRSGAWHALMSAVPSMVPGWDSVLNYNDAPETTHADVLAMFDRAIAKLEKP